MATTDLARVVMIDLAEVRPPKCKTCKERPRIGNAAPRKASASSKLPVVEAVAVVAMAAAADAVAAAGAGVKKSQLRLLRVRFQVIPSNG